MTTGIFIQVRLGSTRLPAKALLPLPGGSIIQHVMRALNGVPAEVRALVTDEGSQAALRPLAAAEGYDVFVGPEEDVLGRYCLAARAYDTGRVIRATGDNPLVSARLAREIIAEHENAHADLSHYLGIPWGSGIEVVTDRALFEAERRSTRQDEREHITTWMYRHPESVSILECPPPPYAALSVGRVTVDTQEDLEEVTRLFKDLYDGNPIEIDRVVAWLTAHPAEGSGAAEPGGRAHA